MSAKAAFLRTYEQEHARTRRLLESYPADKTDLRPHERSSPAMMLGWMFVLEERLMLKAVRREPTMGGGMPPAPDSWADVIAAFDEVHTELTASLNEAKDLEGSTQFMVGPKQVGDYTIEDFLWFMLHDQIHHRGQLSVYTRMAGGKVPSIYGPSADEPWR